MLESRPVGTACGTVPRRNAGGFMLQFPGRWRSLVWVLWVSSTAVSAAEPPRAYRDVVYAQFAGGSLGLDVYVPAQVAQPPLVIYLHGGAWMNGDKTQYPTFLTERGFAVASVDFRSTNDARFPANVHDIKAAIRFLRGNASKYGYRADRIAISGASSGAHLAALVGVTSGVAALEGTQGAYPRESSAVQAIVSWFGASNLTTILAQSTPYGVEVRVPALEKLLGGQPDKQPELARLASPVFQVDRNDPPAFLLHGDQDPQMPVNQLLELQAAYRRAGLEPETLILNGVAHSAPPFFEGEPADRVVSFLHRTIGR
jgi:acetyl esterase/lipase